MHSSHEGHSQESTPEIDLDSKIADSNVVAAKKADARAYEIRRHLEDLEERRRLKELFDDLDY